MKGVERVVEHILSHQEQLSNFGRIALEVYIAYILERAIEHFHAAIGRCFGHLMEKVNEYRESVTGEVFPGIIEKIRKALTTFLPTVKSLWKKVGTFFCRTVQK